MEPSPERAAYVRGKFDKWRQGEAKREEGKKVFCVKMENYDDPHPRFEFFFTAEDAAAFAEFITESFKGDRPEFKVLYHGVQDSWQTAAAAMAEYKDSYDIESDEDKLKAAVAKGPVCLLYSVEWSNDDAIDEEIMYLAVTEEEDLERFHTFDLEIGEGWDEQWDYEHELRHKIQWEGGGDLNGDYFIVTQEEYMQKKDSYEHRHYETYDEFRAAGGSEVSRRKKAAV